MAKIKQMPTFREKKRYISYEIVSDKEIPKRKAVDSIRQSFLKYVGTRGFAQANFQVIRNLIRVNTKFVDPLKMSMLLIRQVDNTDVIIKTKVSGIMKKVI